MKLKFKNQDFQEAATAAVCDVFEGQPYHDPNVYTVDPGKKGVRTQGVGVSGKIRGHTLFTAESVPSVARFLGLALGNGSKKRYALRWWNTLWYN